MIFIEYLIANAIEKAKDLTEEEKFEISERASTIFEKIREIEEIIKNRKLD